MYLCKHSVDSATDGSSVGEPTSLCLWLISMSAHSKMSVWFCNLIRQNPREENGAKRSRTCLCFYACSTSLKQRWRKTNEFWQHGVLKPEQQVQTNVCVLMNTDKDAEASCDAWIYEFAHLIPLVKGVFFKSIPSGADDSHLCAANRKFFNLFWPE